jgi:hypothetical protein
LTQHFCFIFYFELIYLDMAPWPNLLPCTISFYDHSGLWIWVPHGVMCTWSAYGKANSIHLWWCVLDPSVVMCTWSICGDVYLIHLWWGVLDPLVRSTCGEVYSIHLGWSVLDPLVVKCIPSICGKVKCMWPACGKVYLLHLWWGILG